ncbi:MAG: hypothetical protein R6U61_00810 [Thermoplasmata archaeon]
MSFLWKAKDEIYLTVGIILLIIGALFDLVSILIMLEDIEIGAVALFIFTLIFVLPALVLIRHGLNVREKQDKLEKLKVYLERNKRIRVSRLAQVISENELDTVSLLEEAMDKDLFQGTYDEEDGEQYFVFTDYSYENTYE